MPVGSVSLCKIEVTCFLDENTPTKGVFFCFVGSAIQPRGANYTHSISRKMNKDAVPQFVNQGHAPVISYACSMPLNREQCITSWYYFVVQWDLILGY